MDILAILADDARIARMLLRRARIAVEARLAEAPAVALLGPRQVGKTTLALEIAETRPGSIYLDLEAEAGCSSPSDRSSAAAACT